MNEIENIKNSIKPSETLFVVDSMTGQDAVNKQKPLMSVLTLMGGFNKIRWRYTRWCRIIY